MLVAASPTPTPTGTSAPCCLHIHRGQNAMANIHSEVLTTTDKTDTQQANAPPEPKPSFIKDRTTEQTYCTRTGRGRTIIEDRTTEHYAQKREELCSHLRETDIKRTIQYSIVHARSHARVLSMWFVAFHGNHISKRSMCIPRPYLCNAYSHRHLVRTRFAVLRGYTGAAIYFAIVLLFVVLKCQNRERSTVSIFWYHCHLHYVRR